VYGGSFFFKYVRTYWVKVCDSKFTAYCKAENVISFRSLLKLRLHERTCRLIELLEGNFCSDRDLGRARLMSPTYRDRKLRNMSKASLFREERADHGRLDME